MTAATHRFVPADEFARRPGDETHPLARLNGPDWRAALQIKDHPYAEDDTSAWDALFGGTEPFDAAPDLTAYARSTAGLSGGGL